MKRLPISISVITRDEERNLERCLASVAGLGAEIVVMESGSTDGTRAVAERHGAVWWEQEWLGYRDQKNAVLEKCVEPWVLALDADVEVSVEMRGEIEAFFGGGGVKVPDYRNKFEKNVFGDQRKINLLVDLFLQTVCP